jgi:hypothetical protein
MASRLMRLAIASHWRDVSVEGMEDALQEFISQMSKSA